MNTLHTTQHTTVLELISVCLLLLLYVAAYVVDYTFGLTYLTLNTESIFIAPKNYRHGITTYHVWYEKP